MLSLQNSQLLKNQCFINGEWRSADSGATVDVENPATGAVITTIPFMGEAETTAAIAHANVAWKGWKKTTGKQRSQILRRWFELLIENQNDLAIILSAEQGKPVKEALGEIAYAASFIEWFSEEAKRIYGDVIPEVAADTRLTVRKEPIGVCAAVTPWNFPAAMITRKAGPALAAGCPIIIKPATQTPLTAFALVELARQAGIPAGIVQVVTGRASAIGNTLCASPDVRKLSFTGSTDIGIQLMQQCAANVKKVSLELGGNAPFIVFDDADIDKAVEGALIAKFRNNGQTCVCANRILVQSGVYDQFAQKLAAAVDKLVVAAGSEAKVDLGPLIDSKAFDSIKAMVSDALQKGASQVSSRAFDVSDEKRFMNPVVLTDATTEMAVYREEIFGPVAALFRFDTVEDAITLANDTEYGLASYLYTQSIQTYIEVSEALEYGMVGVNTGLISNEVAPFGGVKASGIGREGSKYGIDDYLEIKYVCLGAIMTFNTQAYAKFAHLFHMARSEQQPIKKLPALSEANYAQGYEVQKAFVVASGQSLKTVTGWKAAMGTRAAMQRFQISEPIYGALFSDMAVTEGVAKSENFIAPKLEAEVAFILKQDLCGQSLSNAAIVEAIGFIAPALEIADCRIEGWTFDIPHFIADNAVAAGYQLGLPIEFTGPEQLTDLACTLSFADQTLLGSADAVLGGPMASFIKMVRGILEIHGELHAGQLFLSGSLTKPIDMQAGTEYRLNLFDQELKLAYQ